MNEIAYNNKENSRNFGVDILRSACMLYIVGYWHVYNYIDPIEGYRNVFTDLLTRIALGVFFLLAGYYSSCGFERCQKNIIDFYKAKIIRVYPLFLIALGLFFLLKINSFRATVTGAFLISMFVEPPPTTLWFITMLVVLYAITPLLFKLIHHLSYISFIVVCASCLIILLGYEHITGLLDIRLIMYSPSYALGLVMSQRKVNVRIKSWMLWALVFLSFGLVAATDEIQNRNWVGLYKTPFITLVACILVKWAVSIKKNGPKLIMKWIKWISYSSFCMYLFHRPVYIFLLWIFNPKSNILQIGYLVLLGVPITFLLATIIQCSYDTLIDHIMKPKTI